MSRKITYASDWSWSLMSSYHVSAGKTAKERRLHYETRVNVIIGDCPIAYYLKQRVIRLAYHFKLWFKRSFYG